MKIWLSIITIVLTLFSFTYLQAQEQGVEEFEETITLSITLIPSNPQPLQKVIARVTTYDGDISRTFISWKLNGVLLESGMGKNQIEFTAPASGTVGVLEVSGSLDGISGNATETIIPGAVDLLWEATDSYTPPFYKGKALPAAQGTIRVTAVPSATAPRTLSYLWEKNGSILQGFSGSGKNTISFKNGDIDVQEEVSVTASSTLFDGTNSIVITPTKSPSVLIYKKREGFIDYTRGTIESLSIPESSTTLRIEPYYFSLSGNLAQSLRFNYAFNNEEFLTDGQVNEISLSRPENGGTTVFRVTIESIKNALQNANRRFNLLF